jgi:serine/threonine protein kinase
MFEGFADKGNYGMLYYALRNGYDGYLLKTGPRSLKEEACLQQAAYYILGAHGLPWAVPQVYDIVEHPRYGVCFTMDNVEPVLTFGDYLIAHMKWKEPCRENDVMIFEIIAQLAIYILILEEQLGLNHRDLKLNNVLMVKEEALNHVVVECSPHIKACITASVRAVLIDFGFACIGDLERPRLLLSANEFLPSVVDMCPKVGRDMFLIFANLWNVRALRRALTPGATMLFKRWLMDVKGKDWALWLSSDIDKELTQTYNMVNNAAFQAPWSRPISVLKDIAAAYPGILRME